jgi:hypothetical protein
MRWKSTVLRVTRVPLTASVIAAMARSLVPMRLQLIEDRVSGLVKRQANPLLIEIEAPLQT